MIHQAKEKDIYDELIIGDILQVSQKFEEGGKVFDLFICTDVLVYVGECLEFFASLKRISNRTSRFVFSTENKEGDGYVLLKTGRYAHSYKYISDCIQKLGHRIIDCQIVSLRIQNDSESVNGNLFIVEIDNDINFSS